MDDGLWKKPETVTNPNSGFIPKVGLWSRSRALRVVVWVALIVAVVVLALFSAAYLTGFDSVGEMFNWYRVSFKF